jgi:hypothetical protein
VAPANGQLVPGEWHHTALVIFQDANSQCHARQCFVLLTKC